MMPTDNNLNFLQRRQLHRREERNRRLFPFLVALAIAVEVAAVLFILSK